MGIFGSIGKVLAGKPVNSPQDQANQNVQPDGGQPMSQQPNQQTEKVIPMVRFRRIENQWHGSQLVLYADTVNESTVPVYLDYILFNNVKRQLDIQLNPGEVRQVVIYDNQVLQDRPGGYAEIQYRTTSTGDYFISYHEIRTDQQGESGLRVTELVQRGPVKDIR